MVYTMTRRHSSPTDPVKVRAKVFSNGRSQAIRLPKEFRFAGTEVLVHRDGDAVILEPVPVAAWPRSHWANVDKLRRGLRITMPEPLGGALLDIAASDD